jgi:hypothetical protein
MAATATFQDTTNNSILNTIQGVPVSGSGMDTTTVGPMAPLDKNPYSQSILSYPRDINSSQKAHSVRFIASQITPSDFSAITGYIKKTATAAGDAIATAANDPLVTAENGVKAIYSAGGDVLGTFQSVGNYFITNTGQQVASDGKAAAASTWNGAVKTGGEVVSATGEVLSTINNNRLTSFTGPKTGNAADVITLYMPDNAESNYHSKYGEIGLGAAIGSIPVLGAIPNALQNLLQTNVAKVAMQRMGYVFNDQEQVMFEGIDFRTFSMSFTLTPFSRAEAAEITNIIKTFRKNAAPKITTGGAGFFMIPPSIFQIQFLYNNAENPNINKVKKCVLMDVNVNYAPNGTWSTHDDGSPVQTSLTLSFKEIELVDRTDVEAGY